MANVLTTPRSFGGCIEAQRLLIQAGHELRIQKPEKPYTAKELCTLIKGADAFIAGLDEISSEVMQAGLPSLKIIARNGVGFDNIDIEAARKHGIIVTVTPGTNSIAVCELSFALMMALARKAHLMDDAIRQGAWSRMAGNELYGKTLGVLGTGAIGKELIKRCHAFGMYIVAYDLYPDAQLSSIYKVQYTDLETVCKQADYLSLHLPVYSETRKIINGETIGKMKKGAVIINTARGELIDEDALVAALESGHLGGAGLDVFTQEPFIDQRFFALKNVIMTPHSAAYTEEAVARTFTAAAQEVLRVLSNQTPLYAIV